MEGYRQFHSVRQAFTSFVSSFKLCTSVKYEDKADVNDETVLQIFRNDLPLC